jgi:hypothetical protein
VFKKEKKSLAQKEKESFDDNCFRAIIDASERR